MSFRPQTPQSPSQVSPSSTEPPLGVVTSLSIATSLPTPTHSVNGSMASQPSDLSQDVNMSGGEESPQKRKRSIDDVGDREGKKMHLEDDSRLGLMDLHLDVGPKYLLCKTPHQPTWPRTSEDLFEMFGLTDIAATVARTLPNGEKNAIRKTYKGHIKKLGVNGHFDVVKKEPGEEDSFAQILAMPEQEWGVHFVKGKEVEDGLSPAVQSNLVRAMTMAKGSIPKQVWDSAVLGELAPANVVAAGQKPPSAKPTAPSTPAGISAGSAVVLTPGNPAPARGVLSKNSVATAATNAAAIGASQQAQAAAAAREAERPKRNIKKRTYGDTSFEGYGEGFMDDDLDGGLDADGYDTGEGLDDRQKRRKKTHPNPAAFPAPVRQQSYGPGMVGA